MKKCFLKWIDQMANSGWTEAMIEEALQTEGQVYKGINHINPGNPLKI
jgi:hypothetical protein